MENKLESKQENMKKKSILKHEKGLGREHVRSGRASVEKRFLGKPSDTQFKKKRHFFLGAINVSVVDYVYITVEFASCLPWCHQMESVPLLFYPGATEA